MSNLSDLGLDADVKESDGTGAGGITLIPKGKYKAVIVKDDVRKTQDGDGKGIELFLQIVEGKYADTVLRNWINLKNKNPDAQTIGQGEYKRICRITGVPYPPPDTTQTFGKPILLTVTVKPYYKNKDKNVNDVVAFNPVPADFVAEVAGIQAETPTPVQSEDEPW